MCVLLVVGVTLEVIGLVLVLAELAIIRSDELGGSTPWALARDWIRRKLGRGRTFDLPVALEASGALSVRARKRPGALPDDVTVRDEIAWLRRYVTAIDDELSEAFKAIDRKADDVLRAVAEADDRVRAEIATREAERLRRVGPSLARQSIGATCVLAGTILSAIASA